MTWLTSAWKTKAKYYRERWDREQVRRLQLAETMSTARMAERMQRNLLNAADERVEQLLELIGELADPGECYYDHHGYCQAHSLHAAPCPHSRAQELLDWDPE